MEVRVGLCGFSMSMREYARRFPVVEVQNTFYEPPPDGVMAKWRATTGPALEYTLKVWQLVTHSANSPTYRRMQRKLGPDDAPGAFRASAAVDEGWRRSIECANVLSATAMLFQCPASFRPDRDNVDNFRRFFERIERPSARLLWEPRGPEWVAASDLARSICRDLDLVHVVDPFVTPATAGGDVYWRLHGIGSLRHSYSDAELDELARMLEDAAPDQPAYVLFNNLPRVGDAARFLQRLTGAETGRAPRRVSQVRSRSRPAT